MTQDGRFAAFTYLRADADKIFDMDNDVSAKGDALMAGLGLAYQHKRLRFDASAAFNHRSFEGALGDDDFIRYGATIDVRVIKGLWLEAGGGDVIGSDYLDGAYFSLSAKIGWSDLLSR